MNKMAVLVMLVSAASQVRSGEVFPKPYSPPCVERENVFEFTEKPAVKKVGEDKYEITFAVKGGCDVAVSIVDADGKVVRHLGAGVLGPNAPAPFQKGSWKQTLSWNGKNDLMEYVREPGRLRVRVALGLKPEFDKLLAGKSPYNIPGRIKGLAAGPDGVYVFSLGRRGKLFIRKFDLAGNYVQSLVPPPANLPEEKLGGMGYIEYEKGRRAVHGTDIYQTTGDHLRYPVSTLGGGLQELQAVVVGDRLYFANSGGYGVPTAVYAMHTDGSTDVAGITGRPLAMPGKGIEHPSPRFCASPDGKWFYVTGFVANQAPASAVLRLAREESGPAAVWIGDLRDPGSDAAHLNKPCGIACDAQGRVYVADLFNGRLQVFSPDAKLLKSIPLDKPMYVCVHPKTGAIYVQQDTRIEGKTVRRTTKLRSWEQPEVVGFVDGPFGMMVLDVWSAKPRLWYSNVAPQDLGLLGDAFETGNNISVWEDEGTQFRKVLDFEEKAKQEDGPFYVGRWGGSGLGNKVACDPTRETVLVDNGRLFDLKTGMYRCGVKIPAYSYDDVAFDLRGYAHVHLNPGFDGNPGVLRVNPGRAVPRTGRKSDEGEVQYWPEVPYDYGIDLPGAYSEPRKGVLPCRDQPGAKYFQDGIGVNMMGEVAENSNIYYVPKMDDLSRDFIAELRGALPPGAGGRFPSYAAYAREVQEREKRGEEVYSIRREPGIALAGGTIWTFKHTGELHTECAVIAGGLINGTQIDEDGNIYFVAGTSGRTRFVGGKAFLAGQAGHYGTDKKENPFTGTLIKTKGQKLRILWDNAPVPLDPKPSRPPDLVDCRFGDGATKGWVESAEWLYAGASPIVSGGCSCPTERLYVDWFKRVHVPEQYRHSIGILDTAGNLIMHLGRFGNFDSGDGAKSRVPVGGDNIAMSAVRFISGTDNYLVFDDGGERLVVLKLNYHAEETVAIGG